MRAYSVFWSVVCFKFVSYGYTYPVVLLLLFIIYYIIILLKLLNYHSSHAHSNIELCADCALRSAVCTCGVRGCGCATPLKALMRYGWLCPERFTPKSGPNLYLSPPQAQPTSQSAKAKPILLDITSRRAPLADDWNSTHRSHSHFSRPSNSIPNSRPRAASEHL